MNSKHIIVYVGIKIKYCHCNCCCHLTYYIKKEIPITRDGANTIKATDTGKTYNQQTSINWSYRSLGNVALNHTKKKQNTQVLIPKANAGILIYKSFKENK